MTADGTGGLGDELRAHERHVWGVAYRMTGSAADADDVVQETFTRAIAAPPRRDMPLRPWLVTVALNLARDALRARKRRPYTGPWLPSPVDTRELEDLDPASERGPDARYDLLESASFAFLIAVEALSPSQRAVLLLRDVLDYSVAETARALGRTETSVKTTHHRARAAMADYDRDRVVFTPERYALAGAKLAQLVTAVTTGDLAGAEALLARDVVALSDAGGEHAAALRPVLGRDRVARFILGLQRKSGSSGSVVFRSLNGMPALAVELDGDHGPRFARRYVVRCEVGADGSIVAIHSIAASPKLGRIWPAAGPVPPGEPELRPFPLEPPAFK